MAEQNEPRQRYGYTTESGERVSALLDMIDGGGRGTSGSQFQGGLLSSVLNSLGVRPYGYSGREQSVTASVSDTAPSLMAAPATTAPRPVPPVGMTGMPALTADQIRILRDMGFDVDAMAGEPASHSELAALLRGPGALLAMGGPNAQTTAPMQPGMNVMPDGETFLRQNLAVIPAMTGPSMNMPQTDIGTIRPFVSRSTGRIPPMMDMPPMRGVTNPPPMSAMLLPR